MVNLNLKKNVLIQIEESDLNYLPKLSTLVLDYNRIKILKNNILQPLTAIETVSIQFNKIRTIESYAFKGLINLRNILLNNNKLIDINYIDFNLTNLKYLNISW